MFERVLAELKNAGLDVHAIEIMQGGEVMLHALEGAGVYCSTGSACSSKKRHVSPVLLAMGLTPDRAEWALRFSLSPYTTDDEIRYAAKQAGTLHATLRRFKRR